MSVDDPVMVKDQASTENSNMLKLGIMGGTFDPIHLGHLRLAEVARQKINFKKVIFVTSHCPPHKSIKDLTPVQHRHAMTELATRDNPFFESSRIEIERPCPTYAGETIETFKELYGEDWQIYFITGLDALLTIINWHRARTYPGLCRFIAAIRPGYLKERIESKIPAAFWPFITILEEPMLSISSTTVRSRIKANQPVDDLVPKTVREYILKWGLYQGK